jgi:hypothetical protein
VTIIVFLRPRRSLNVPKTIPPVAQPIIIVAVAQPPHDFTAASLAAFPKISRSAGPRQSAKRR